MSAIFEFLTTPGQILRNELRKPPPLNSNSNNNSAYASSNIPNAPAAITGAAVSSPSTKQHHHTSVNTKNETRIGVDGNRLLLDASKRLLSEEPSWWLTSVCPDRLFNIIKEQIDAILQYGNVVIIFDGMVEQRPTLISNVAPTFLLKSRIFKNAKPFNFNKMCTEDMKKELWAVPSDEALSILLIKLKKEYGFDDDASARVRIMRAPFYAIAQLAYMINHRFIDEVYGTGELLIYDHIARVIDKFDNDEISVYVRPKDEEGEGFSNNTFKDFTYTEIESIVKYGSYPFPTLHHIFQVSGVTNPTREHGVIPDDFVPVCLHHCPVFAFTDGNPRISFNEQNANNNQQLRQYGRVGNTGSTTDDITTSSTSPVASILKIIDPTRLPPPPALPVISSSNNTTSSSSSSSQYQFYSYLSSKLTREYVEIMDFLFCRLCDTPLPLLLAMMYCFYPPIALRSLLRKYIEIPHTVLSSEYVESKRFEELNQTNLFMLPLLTQTLFQNTKLASAQIGPFRHGNNELGVPVTIELDEWPIPIEEASGVEISTFERSRSSSSSPAPKGNNHQSSVMEKNSTRLVKPLWVTRLKDFTKYPSPVGKIYDEVVGPLAVKLKVLDLMGYFSHPSPPQPADSSENAAYMAGEVLRGNYDLNNFGNTFGNNFVNANLDDVGGGIINGMPIDYNGYDGNNYGNNANSNIVNSPSPPFTQQQQHQQMDLQSSITNNNGNNNTTSVSTINEDQECHISVFAEALLSFVSFDNAPESVLSSIKKDNNQNAGTDNVGNGSFSYSDELLRTFEENLTEKEIATAILFTETLRTKTLDGVKYRGQNNEYFPNYTPEQLFAMRLMSFVPLHTTEEEEGYEEDNRNKDDDFSDKDKRVDINKGGEGSQKTSKNGKIVKNIDKKGRSHDSKHSSFYWDSDISLHLLSFNCRVRSIFLSMRQLNEVIAVNVLQPKLLTKPTFVQSIIFYDPPPSPLMGYITETLLCGGSSGNVNDCSGNINGNIFGVGSLDELKNKFPMAKNLEKDLKMARVWLDKLLSISIVIQNDETTESQQLQQYEQEISILTIKISEISSKRLAITAKLDELWAKRQEIMNKLQEFNYNITSLQTQVQQEEQLLNNLRSSNNGGNNIQGGKLSQIQQNIQQIKQDIGHFQKEIFRLKQELDNKEADTLNFQQEESNLTAHFEECNILLTQKQSVYSASMQNNQNVSSNLSSQPSVANEYQINQQSQATRNEGDDNNNRHGYLISGTDDASFEAFNKKNYEEKIKIARKLIIAAFDFLGI